MQILADLFEILLEGENNPSIETERKFEEFLQLHPGILPYYPFQEKDGVSTKAVLGLIESNKNYLSEIIRNTAKTTAEFINSYSFLLSSGLLYWYSSDCVLLELKKSEKILHIELTVPPFIPNKVKHELIQALYGELPIEPSLQTFLKYVPKPERQLTMHTILNFNQDINSSIIITPGIILSRKSLESTLEENPQTFEDICSLFTEGHITLRQTSTRLEGKYHLTTREALAILYLTLR